jgi:hypothetical protein
VAEHGRQVFSYFGSGAFLGAAILLSRFFVMQPSIFAKEAAELAAIGVRPVMFGDPDAQVTTPFDVFINRWVEETRGGTRRASASGKPSNAPVRPSAISSPWPCSSGVILGHISIGVRARAEDQVQGMLFGTLSRR